MATHEQITAALQALPSRDRLAVAMTLRRLRQVQLAQSTGLSQSRVSLLVNGGTPTAREEALIARVLELDPSMVFPCLDQEVV